MTRGRPQHAGKHAVHGHVCHCRRVGVPAAGGAACVFVEATAGLSPCGAHRRLPVCCGGHCRSTPCVDGPSNLQQAPVPAVLFAHTAAAAHTAVLQPQATLLLLQTVVLPTQLCCCRRWSAGHGWSGQVQRCHPTVHAATGTGSRQGVVSKPQPAAGLRCASTPTCCCRAPVPADTPVLPHSPQVLQRFVFLSTTCLCVDNSAAVMPC